MCLPVLVPIAGALLAPLTRAFAASFGIGGICCKFSTTVVGPALALTFRAAADDLFRMTSRGLKGLLAIRTGARRQTNSSEVCFKRKPRMKSELLLALWRTPGPKRHLETTVESLPRPRQRPLGITGPGFHRPKWLPFSAALTFKKNDQAWIEQKNGSVVRRLVGYGQLVSRVGLGL